MKSGDKKKSKSANLFPPSSAPAGFYGEFERKQEMRLPRTHSSALPFHPLTFCHSHKFSQSYDPQMHRIHS